MTIRMDTSEKSLIAKYARSFEEGTSELMRLHALERIEDIARQNIFQGNGNRTLGSKTGAFD